MSDNITKEEFLALDTEEKNTKQKNTEEKNTISKEEFLSLEKTEGSQTTDVTAEPQKVSTDTESTSEPGSLELQNKMVIGEKKNKDGTITLTFDDDTNQIFKEEEIPENLNYSLGFIPEVKVESPKEDKFNVFGFLNPENKKEYKKNVTNFFNLDEEKAQVQLQKILGPEYEIKQINRLDVTKGDPELKKLKKSLFQINTNVLKIKKGD